MIHRAIINQYKNRLENIKEKVRNEEIICYFAKEPIEKLLKEEKRLKIVFQEMSAENEIIEEVDSLIYETKQFLKDIINIIDIERKTCL